VDDHPWAISTCNFAELYYRLANEIMAGGTIPLDANSTEFFRQVGVNASTTPAGGRDGVAERRRPDAAGRAVTTHDP
jgi:glucoamylase